jgi:opacity protein-like surface antigen
MKNLFRMVVGLLVGGSSLLFAPLTGRCGADGLYFKADAGGNVTEDIKLLEFFGPVTPGSKIKLDPGVRFGLTAGYDVCDWFGFEGELGVVANKISSITAATDVHDAYFENAPFLVNAKLHLPYWYCLSPYVGAGVGGSISILDVDHVTINDISLHGSDAEAVFAWQAFAGLRYAINKHMGVSVEYRYFVADSPTWTADEAFGTASDKIRFGHAYTHSASVAFDWRF